MDAPDRLTRFTEWVKEHGPAVRAYTWAALRDGHEADDLVQELFRRCWEQWDRYQEMGSPRAYLIRIADRLVVDRLRSFQRQTPLPEDDLPGLGQWRDDPANRCEQDEACSAVRQALDQLTALQRRVLLLRYFGQMSFAEIAAHMDLPLNTVLSHCHRGLKNLRKLLAEFAP